MVHDQYVSSTGKIPEEAKALSLLAPAAPAPSLIPGGGLLPIPTPAPLQNLNVPAVSRLSAALDPTASSLTQAPLMGNVDPSKVDEIRRTVYVGNLNSQTTNADQLLEFFKQVGEVKFVRMAGDETQPTRFAFVEFVGQESVNRALTFNGVMFGDRPLKVNHSNNAIVKPPEMTPQAAAKELESVMKRVREAQCTIAAAIDPADLKKCSPSRSRRLCRSRSLSRSRSCSKMHRKRSRSKQSRPAPKLCPRNDSHNSRSSHRRSSLSRDKKHSRSRSRGHRRKSKDRSRSPRRKAKSPSPKRGRKDKRRERSRDRKERSTSRKRSRKDEEKMKSKAKPMKVERDYDREEKDEYESDREDTLSEDMMSSPCAQQNGSYKTHNEYASMGADNKGLFHRHGN
ncbi:splicing regulatory glutamine/lysine-rich protein 1 isoform X3 [Trematomus bernacchii]|uniref:splicing regulatory glutamine/lysine-rich protein 1 isoform X3 n=1 Tax=Trematomus bernacchii TaxID=40690 RepID=UPI00146C08EE|nr:splicing regulatory glutamine/lysine-rich protein 1 isoform X3 [Trematomus bernacchii]XP_033978728.1 splicing regulatory glutamine/lysine-rich protein 1 isoform X3 [Trematomus bernacchii]XP_033978729.1 splicing regulatory glutamine/lysine-rich protein 1 isoform X3 [Trematomus bernacchii]XP_033978730.1 splicing regulatory glutamine/lysine-rich protein 1 isoform X3 [Trematomus bernacchii]